VVVRAGRRAADAVVVLVGIGHLVIRGAEHASLDDVGRDHFNHNAGDDNRLAHDHVDEYFDHDDRGSIAGHRDSCHRSVGAGTRHHRLSHG
jgi:hypothetical protein